MSEAQETPRPPQTREFAHVIPGGAEHVYDMEGCAVITKFSVGQYDNNVYIVRCSNTGEALVVDGAADPERIIEVVGDAKVVAIAQTHNHFDHVQALSALVEAWGCTVYAHDDDSYPVPTESVTDGQKIDIGGVSVEVLYTPGHTPGGLTFRVGSTLLTGDTLFPGGPGATGKTSQFAQVMGSLDRLFALPDETRVCPGHGLDTTLGRERPHVETWRARGW